MNNKQKVIIGLSPGRTGSKSIAHILTNQNRSSANHEHPPKLPYVKDLKLFHENVRAVSDKHKDSKYLCFNGFFYTWYIDDFVELFPDVKIYVLSRDIDKTIQSHYTKVTKRVEGHLMYKNYWNDRDRGRCKSDWEPCFPNTGKGLELKEGITKYVYNYWNYIGNYLDKYPDKMRVFNIEKLNDTRNMLNFLRYVGIEDEDIRMPENKVQIVNRWFEVNDRRGGKSVKFKGI